MTKYKEMTMKDIYLAAGSAYAASVILTELYHELVGLEVFSSETEEAVKLARDACDKTRAALRKISFEELNVRKNKPTDH